MAKTIEEAVKALTIARAEASVANKKAVAARTAADTLGRIAVSAAIKIETAQVDLDQAIDAQLKIDDESEAKQTTIPAIARRNEGA